MRRIFFSVVLCVLSACADGVSEFPVTAEDQAALSEDVTIVTLTPQNAQSLNRPAHRRAVSHIPGPVTWKYLVGRGDILSVIVFDHPELTLPGGTDRGAADMGFRVQSDGTFFYPFVGQVQAAGLAPEDIRADLIIRLAEFIADPQLEVRVAAFNSQAINVTGAVGLPKRLPITTVPMTLVDAVNAAGGLAADADPARVTIQRNGQTYHVDFDGFLTRGIAANNPVLGSGDVVFVPARIPQEVFVLGEVGQPTSIDLDGQTVSLTEVLARQGGLDTERADARGVFVFRRAAGTTTVFQLSVTSPTGYLTGRDFHLAAGDVVYVTRSPRQRWNDTIYGLLPSITAVDTTNTTLGAL